MSLRHILCIFCSIFLVLNKVLQTNGTPKTLSDEERAEIDKIRAELGEALQNYEDKEISQKNVVVQPGWTVVEDKKLSIDGRVLANPQNLQETEALRAEIRKAVMNDKYARVSSQAGKSKNIKKLHEKFAKSMHNEKLLRNLLTGASHDKEEIVGGAAAEQSSDSNRAPNIVDSNAFVEADIDIAKLQKFQVSKRRAKEVLILEGVEEDYSFNLGEDVQEWEFLRHKGEEYFIGRRETDLLIVTKNAATYKKARVVPINSSICYLESYSFWNQQRQIQEGVILVASGKRIAWYRTNEHAEQEILLSWEWIVGNAISGLKYFTYDSSEYLIVSSKSSLKSGYYALNIYQFDLNMKEFWLVQRLQMQYPCSEVSIMDTGRDLILAIAQNNTVAIYAFNNHGETMDCLRFKFLMGVESPQVAAISAFQMGGHSYLAIGGTKPQILVYHEGTFESKTVLGDNFGLVEFYFPVPVRTYRDDLILLIQHRVDFETHALTVLETLIWNGEAFEASIPVPCHLDQQLVYGVSCMLDIQRAEGLKGAALLRRDDDVSIIVPRKNVESGLFRLKTKLLAKNSELLDLQETFEFLKSWVNEQDELIAQAEKFLQTDLTYEVEADVSHLSSLTAPEVYFNGSIGEILINGYKWTEEDASIDLDTIISAMEQLEVDVYSGRHKRDIDNELEDFDYDTLIVSDVNVEELLIDELNGVPFYIQNGELTFNGTLNLQNLSVLEESLTRPRRQVEEMGMEINEHLICSEINGILWQDIEKNIIFRNSPIEVDGLQVKGDIIIEEDLSINELNNLSFPDDYLWASSPTTSIVSANKTFMGKFSANAVDTMQGLINGVDPMRAITLSGPQFWQGSPIFRSLEVTEKLQLNGTIQSSNTKDFPTNPTLEHAELIKALSHFESLEVLGPLILKGNLDDVNLTTLLLDIAQRPVNASQSVLIAASKHFSSIRFPDEFHIKDAKINNMAISEFIPKHSHQLLNRTHFDGHVFFHNLTIGGSYDGLRLEQLLVEAIKINESQNLAGTQLNFVHAIQANELDIRVSLNQFPIEDYQTVDNDVVLNEAYFRELNVESANVPHNIRGEAKLNGINLREFLRKREWNNATTTPWGNIFLDELILSDGLEARELHGMEPAFLFQFLEQIDDVPAMILDGKILVDKIVVAGNVQINKLNGLNFDEDLQKKVIWLNRQNQLNNNLTFVRPLLFGSDLHILGHLNGDNLPQLIDDMVFRDDNQTHQILLSGKKIFYNDVFVLNKSTVDQLSGIDFMDLATKSNVNNFQGSLSIKGDVSADEMKFDGFFNNFHASNLTNTLDYDTHYGAFVIKGDSILPHQMQLQDLTVLGSIYDVDNFQDFLNNLVCDKKVELNGNYTFTGRVTIEENAFVRQINGLELSERLKNIVLVSEPQHVNHIDGAVKFMSPVKAAQFVVRQNLYTNNLQGNSLQNWRQDTLSIDTPANISVPLVFAANCLDQNLLEVDSLNGIDMSQVITLHTPQNLSSDLIFSELLLHGNLNTKGLINNVDVQHEYNNTLLNFGNQHISTPLTMSKAEVLVNLRLNAPLNGERNLQQVATLHGVQVFQSPLFFQEVSARQIQTNHLISGINMNDWFVNALWLNERPQQLISGNWSARRLLLKNMPQFLLDGSHNAFERRARSVARQYEQLWYRFKSLKQQMTENHVNLPKHVELAFEMVLLNATENITMLQIFNNEHLNLLIASTQNVTTFYELQPSQQKLKLLHALERQTVGQILMIPKNKRVSYLLMQNAPTLDLYEINERNISFKLAFDLNITSMLQARENASLVYAVGSKALYEINAETQNYTKLLDLSDLSSHRLMANIEPHKLKICNRTHLMVINRRPPYEAGQRASHSLPLSYRRITAKYLHAKQPNLTAHLALPEFHAIVERELLDLSNHLRLEVNITQLSIPESDLWDEHLAPDFNAIMQQMYAKDVFADLQSQVQQMPSNPAQILAARCAQIIWPFMVDMHNLLDFLNDKKALLSLRPPVEHMIELLEQSVRQILMTAYGNQTDEYASLMLVIQHVRDLELRLQEVKQQLHVLLWQDVVASAEEVKENMTLSHMQNGQKLCDANNELVELQANRKLIVTANQLTGNISVYMVGLNGSQLVQNLLASKPHSLNAVPAGNENLLAFVENCCTVRILSYRGVEGFVDFVHFETEAEISSLLSFHNERNYYLAAVMAKNVILYRIVFK